MRRVLHAESSLSAGVQCEESGTIPSCHLAYLTANDQRDFSVDYLNFRNMARRHPGVPKVMITIAVSRVRPFTAANRRQIEALAKCAEEAPWLKVRVVLWKGNIGRDFSSARACLESIGEVASAEDYVLVRNRSGYGPFTEDWYKAYVEQYERHPGTGLVGSTINLSGPPTMPPGEDGRHVQTYAYLSQWRHLAPLMDDFPGCAATDNPSAILQGEIGLNRRIMAAGLGLSCLQWPDCLFSASSSDDPLLPRRDIKSEIQGLPFLYKFPAYRRRWGALLRRGVWLGALPLESLARRGERPVRHLQVGDCD